MDSSVLNVLLYPYPYQYKAFFFSLLILITIGLPVYGIYRLFIWKMNAIIKTLFHKILVIIGIAAFLLFSAEVTVTIITIHHVNKQMGFNTATPDTQEGELFVVSKIISGETMDEAGLRTGDRIQMSAVNDLYKLLVNNQGSDVSFMIVRNKIKMEINVTVPELDVPLAAVSFLF